MVDEDRQRAGVLGDLADHLAHVRGLLVGEPGGRLVEQHQPRASDDRPGELDQTALARRRACPPCEAGSMSRPTNAIASSTSGGGVDRSAWSARGSSRRCRTPTAPRSPARSGTCGAAPSARGGSASSPGGPRRTRATAAGRGLDEPAQDVEERGLAGAVRPDQAARPLSNLTFISSSGVTPPKRTVRSETSITDPHPSGGARRLTRRHRTGRAWPCPWGTDRRSRAAPSSAPGARRPRTGSSASPARCPSW